LQAAQSSNGILTWQQRLRITGVMQCHMRNRMLDAKPHVGTARSRRRRDLRRQRSQGRYLERDESRA
jgi:hypothetical protein